MLAVVQHNQRSRLPADVGERSECVMAGSVLAADGGEHHVRYGCVGTDSHELDHPRAAREVRAQAARDVAGKASLANTARPRQDYEARRTTRGLLPQARDDRAVL